LIFLATTLWCRHTWCDDFWSATKQTLNQIHKYALFICHIELYLLSQYATQSSNCTQFFIQKHYSKCHSYVYIFPSKYVSSNFFDGQRLYLTLPNQTKSIFGCCLERKSLLLKRMKRRKNHVLLSIPSRGSAAQPRVRPDPTSFYLLFPPPTAPIPSRPRIPPEPPPLGPSPSHAAAAPSPSSIANPPPVAPNELPHPLGQQDYHHHPPLHQPSVCTAPMPPSIIFAPPRPRLRSAAPRTPGRSSAREGPSIGQPPLARRRRGRLEASRAWDLRRPYQPRPRGDGASVLHDAPPPHSPPSASRHLTRLPPRVSPCVPPPHLDHTHSAASSIVIEPILKQIKIHCR
jgi:hypothetical protein